LLDGHGWVSSGISRAGHPFLDGPYAHQVLPKVEIFLGRSGTDSPQAALREMKDFSALLTMVPNVPIGHHHQADGLPLAAVHQIKMPCRDHSTAGHF
jgi:hypothetical protein